MTTVATPAVTKLNIKVAALLAKLKESISAEAPNVPATTDDFISVMICVTQDKTIISTNFANPLCFSVFFITIYPLTKTKSGQS